MYELIVLDVKNNNVFRKMYFNKEKCDSYVNKIKHSNKLKLLSFIDNSYMYD